MKVVEMIFQVMETCQNGKERMLKKKVYSDKMFMHDDAKKMLEQRGYYRIVLLKEEWKDVMIV